MILFTYALYVSLLVSTVVKAVCVNINWGANVGRHRTFSRRSRKGINSRLPYSKDNHENHADL